MQNSNSPIFDIIIFFHDSTIIILIIITRFIIFILLSIIYNIFSNRFLLQNHIIELI
ncbi:hypothetical protein EUZ93_01005 [Wolbachia pipientis]|nr:hypothetical protein [Wolbachia pipientis]NEV49091.1 hypothetical protein [Wolbachia pipientis]